MVTMSFAVLLPYIIFFFFSNSAAQLHLAVNPAVINIGLSDSLDVNCTFSLDGSSGMAEIVSLIISRAAASDQNFEEIASVTDFSDHNVTQFTREDITATGNINSAGESYLHLQWQHPGEDQSGLYQCVAHGVDSVGHNVVNTADVQVTVTEPNIGDLVEKMRELNNQVTSLQQQVASQENCMSKDTCNCLSIFEESSLSYKDRKYFVSKDAYRDFNYSQSVCQLYGGYLAEINDLDEYSAIFSFLENATSYSYVVLGATDKTNEGNWVLATSGQPLPFADWHPGLPRGSPLLNCLYLSYGFQMEDHYCNPDPINYVYRFMCEIPNPK